MSKILTLTPELREAMREALVEAIEEDRQVEGCAGYLQTLERTADGTEILVGHELLDVMEFFQIEQ